MPKTSSSHETAYVELNVQVFKAIKAIQKDYLKKRRALDKKIFDKQRNDEGTEESRFDEKKAAKTVLRAERKKALNAYFQNLQKDHKTNLLKKLKGSSKESEKKTLFKKIELERMISDALNQLCEKEGARKRIIDSIEGFTYQAHIPVFSDHQEHVIQTIESQVKATKNIAYQEKQATWHKEHMQEKARLAARLPEAQKAISTQLKVYTNYLNQEKERLALQGKSLPKDEVWYKSNRVEKLKIANAAISLIQQPITLDNFIEITTQLNNFIAQNRKETGMRLLHGQGKLEPLLKDALTIAIDSIPNGKMLFKLHQYITKREAIISKKGREFYQHSSLASDLPKKVELAKKLFNEFKKGQPSQLSLEKFRQDNRGYTQKGGLHRAGELDGILKEAQINYSPSGKKH